MTHQRDEEYYDNRCEYLSSCQLSVDNYISFARKLDDYFEIEFAFSKCSLQSVVIFQWAKFNPQAFT